MIEAQRVVKYVYDTLVADNGAGGVHTLLSGRIYRDQVPRTVQTWPALVVSLVSAVNTNTTGGRRVFLTVAVDIHFIDQGGDFTAINAAADRADTVLQNTSGAANSVSVVELVQDDVRAYLENDEGQTWAHLVATYSTPAYAT